VQYIEIACREMCLYTLQKYIPLVI